MPPPDEPIRCTTCDADLPINFNEVDIRLPMLVYVSREMRPGYDHNKKTDAMNSLLRASAVMSNGPFILNLDCDHYIFNSKSIREGMCFMMDCDGDQISYVQFPQIFEEIDPSDRCANHNTIFFDINMRELDSLQGPVYVKIGCLFHRIVLYGFNPPTICKKTMIFPEEKGSSLIEKVEETFNYDVLSKKFGHSSLLGDTLSST